MAIAVDGPVASGKTAVGRLVARRLGIRFLDTGAMYRAVTWMALRRGTDLEDEDAVARVARGISWRLAPGNTAAGPGQVSRERLLVDGQDMAGHLLDLEVERRWWLRRRASGRSWWSGSGPLQGRAR
jgi:cytidylate kinase